MARTSAEAEVGSWVLTATARRSDRFLRGLEQASRVTFVSHVHHTCQWPPAVYSVKTPTPCPGAAFIVLFVSTSTRIGVGLGAPLVPGLPDALGVGTGPPALDDAVGPRCGSV